VEILPARLAIIRSNKKQSLIIAIGVNTHMYEVPTVA
jgi:hypothetical protein